MKVNRCFCILQNKEFRLENALDHVLVKEGRVVTALYPPSWTHDISFWVDDSFVDAAFIDLARYRPNAVPVLFVRCVVYLTMTLTKPCQEH